MPMTDSAPLLAAAELGIFSRHGLDVTLSCELGWASIRDRLLHGTLDAAHAPAPMLPRLRAAAAGPGTAGSGNPAAVFSSFILSAGGNAVTLSAELLRQGIRTAADLKRHLRARQPDRPVFAVGSLLACESFLLRQWLESGEIGPAPETRLIVLPPGQMTAALAAGQIDGFCVSEPWNSVAVTSGAGWCPVTSADFPPLPPDKILLTRTAFADRSPDGHAALLRALDEACQWCADPQNRPGLVDLLASLPWFRDIRHCLRPALTGPFDTGGDRLVPAQDLLRFHGDGLNVPTPAKSAWIFSRLQQAGQAPPGGHSSTGGDGIRPDLLHEALAATPHVPEPTAPHARHA